MSIKYEEYQIKENCKYFKFQDIRIQKLYKTTQVSEFKPLLTVPEQQKLLEKLYTGEMAYDVYINLELNFTVRTSIKMLHYLYLYITLTHMIFIFHER